MSTTGNCNKNCNQRYSQAGFTLLELLVVLALAALLTTLALPSLHTFLRGNTTEQSARRIMGLIRESAWQARQEGQPWVLRYDAGTHTLVSLAVSGAGKKKSTRPVLPRTLPLPDDVRLQLLPRLPRLPKMAGTERSELSITREGYVEPGLVVLDQAQKAALDSAHGRLNLVLSPFLATIRVVPGHVDAASADLYR